MNASWAQTSYDKAEINGAPDSSTGWQTIKNQGDVKAWYNGTTTEFTNGAKEIGGKWYVKLSGDGFIKIRIAKGSVVAGDILRVETIDIYQNNDQQNLGFKVKGSNGTVTIQENDNAPHTLDYTLKAADIDVDPDDATYDYIQFDRNGCSGCGYHSVEILKPDGFTITWDQTKNPSGACDAYFTLNDGDTHYKETVSGVAPGTKVSYYANANGSTAWEINGWRNAGTIGSDGWLRYGDTYVIASLSGNIAVDPEFQPVHYFAANAEVGGTAIVYTNSETKANISGTKQMSWVNSVTFEAIPADGYAFTQWEDGNTDNPRTVTGSEQSTTYSHTAQFAVAHIEPSQALECSAELSTSIGRTIRLTAHYVPGEPTATNKGTLWRHARKNASGDLELIPGEEDGWYAYSTYIDFTPEAAGDYYFGVRGYQNCVLTGNEERSTHPTYVHVKVKEIEEYAVTFNASGGWGVAGSMRISDLNSTANVVSTTAKEIGTISIEKGHLSRVEALEFANDVYLKSWTVTRAKDNRYIDGETETVNLYDGLPAEGVVWTDTYRGFDFSSNGVIKNVQANYGRPVHIEFVGSSDGSAKIVYDGKDDWNANSAFREETTIQLKATPNNVDTHKFKQWNLTFYDGNNKIGETKWYFSNQKVVDLKLDRSHTGGSAYTRVVAEPVFEEGSERVDQNVEITVNGATRSYHVYAPIGLEGRSPVLFSLHGKGGDVLTDYTADAAKVQNFKDWSDRDKFIAIYPQGKERNGQTDWLANGAYDNEDVKFFDAIIEDLKTKFTIDDNRIYMTGFAEGAAMTYATAFTSEKFAAFATINGHQEGDTHLQHYGAPIGSPRPVPFVMIQQKNAGNMATIIDNLVARNGANPVPVKTSFSAPSTSICDKYEYSAVPGSYPVEYYQVKDADWNFLTGAIDVDNSGGWSGDDRSQGIFWNFMKNYSRPTTSYDDRCRIEFMPNVEKFNDEFKATEHGWKSDVNSTTERIILQYGDKSDENIDAAGKHGTNVYHTIQLGKGAHQFQFTSNSTAPNTSTMWVTVTIDKVGDIDPATGVVTPCNVQVIKRDYNIGAVSFNINREEEGVGEYRITFQWNNSDESDLGIENGKGITISGISFQNNNGQDKGKQHTEILHEYTRYYNYHGRLIAQWNFDLADAVRFHYPKLSPSYWEPSGPVPANGVVTYSYKNEDMTNENDPVELTYDGTTPIAVAAGLKFYSPVPSKVQIQATFENGVMTKSQLVLDAGVKMTVPYVRNSYRNDKGNWDTKKINPNLKEIGEVDDKKQYQVLADANTALFDEYDDCMHHINRDMIYVSSSPDIWNAIDNWVDGVWNEKFFTGGRDDIEGKYYEKMNYLGKQDGPCVIEFVNKITIDRMGVNRNFVSSFYTEYIYEETGHVKPYPGFRFIAGPSGARIADVGAAAGMYESAIAMTFGGWQHNGNSYKDVNGTVSDIWNELNVYQGGERGEGSQNRNIGPIDDLTTIPVASDGFPVYSRMVSPARSESVNPDASTKYHDTSDGLFKLTTDNGGSLAYKENYTPWSLPARGAHVKFEPTLPGVLNIDVLMNGGSDYWIADEFGKIISNNVFVKTGTKTGTTGETQSVDRTNGHFKVTKTDYVKFSFDVYPGKTYYLFSNNGDLGVSGFYYEPYVYRSSTSVTPIGTDRQKEAIELDRTNVGIWTATMSANENGVVYEWDKVNPHGYTNQCAYVNPGESGYPAEGITQKMQSSTQPISYDNKAVHVIYNRHFDANKWQTICLPYSMNNLQLKQQFGDGVKVVLLRDVQTDDPATSMTTANFVYHMNQDIIAGYPYLIYPSKSTDVVETNAYLGEGVSETPSSSMTPITISAQGPNLVTFPTGTNTYEGIDCYDFVANFKTGVNVPKGSYVLSNGKLTRVMTEGGITAPAFMSYLKYIGGTDAGFLTKSRIDATNYGDVESDDVTNIDDLLLQSGIIGANADVYSVNGIKVRSNADNLQGLSKGIYIVNGKKYIVK